MNTKTMRTMKVVAGIAGTLVFGALALYYWLVPAGSLATFIPGYETGSAHIHVTHGLVAFVLALFALIFAWFSSAKEKEGSE